MSRILAYLIKLLVVGTLYYLLVRFGLGLPAHPGAPAMPTVISPPAGFALAAVLLGGYGVLPALFAAIYMAGPAWPDLMQTGTIVTANACAALAGGWLINEWAGGRNGLAAPGGVARFVLIAIIAAALGASIGAIGKLHPALAVASGHAPDLWTHADPTALLRADWFDWQKVAAVWLPWWFGDVAALLMLTPAVVLWGTDPPRSFDLPALAESMLIFAATVAAAVIALVHVKELPGSAPLAVLIVLPLTWAALRRGPRDTATASLILLLAAGWGTLLVPWARGVRDDPFVLLLMIGVATPSLVLAADAAERRRAQRDLRGARRELGQAREQFAQAQKMEAIGQLTGGVAHDFNNLLTVILGNLGMAQRELRSLTDVPAEKLRRVVNNAVLGAERATTITKHLLALSRKEPLDPKPIDINGVISGLTDFLRRSLGETITLDIIGAGDLWLAEADAVQLETAILNLAVNARHAMAGGGKLTIATENAVLDKEICQTYADVAAGPYVKIAVSDTGTGMSKDVLKRVFEPFFTTKKAGQGTGLGLSQVHGFVKQSRGHIEIDSEPGKGTTFTIYLPALTGTLHQPPGPERDFVVAAAPPTILVVEDDHDVRAYVAEILRELHCRVLEAHDAESALAMIDRNHVSVDLLLTDLVLPEMNGRALAETVKLRRPGTKVLFMTGYARETITDQWPVDGEGEMMQKPLTTDALVHKVRTTLSQAG